MESQKGLPSCDNIGVEDKHMIVPLRVRSAKSSILNPV